MDLRLGHIANTAPGPVPLPPGLVAWEIVGLPASESALILQERGLWRYLRMKGTPSWSSYHASEADALQALALELEPPTH